MTDAPRTYPVAWPTFALAAPTGAVELAVGEWVASSSLRPARVTGLLSAMLERIDGAAVSTDLLWRLSAGTREWLLQQVAATCRAQDDWFDCQCPECSSNFDVSIALASLPKAAVPSGFPLIEFGELRFEAINGATEFALAERGLTDAKAVRFALSQSAVDDNTRAQVAKMNADDLARTEAAIDAATPDCADVISADCPQCGTPLAARVDPLAYAFPGEGPVLQDIHVLGRTYQWREADILAMPTRRRRSYVAMIAQDRGGRHP